MYCVSEAFLLNLYVLIMILAHTLSFEQQSIYLPRISHIEWYFNPLKCSGIRWLAGGKGATLLGFELAPFLDEDEGYTFTRVVNAIQVYIPTFLISDIQALWRSRLSARVSECQKIINVGYTRMAECNQLTFLSFKRLTLPHVKAGASIPPMTLEQVEFGAF